MNTRPSRWNNPAIGFKAFVLTDGVGYNHYQILKITKKIITATRRYCMVWNLFSLVFNFKNAGELYISSWIWTSTCAIVGLPMSAPLTGKIRNNMNLIINQGWLKYDHFTEYSMVNPLTKKNTNPTKINRAADFNTGSNTLASYERASIFFHNCPTITAPILCHLLKSGQPYADINPVDISYYIISLCKIDIKFKTGNHGSRDLAKYPVFQIFFGWRFGK